MPLIARFGAAKVLPPVKSPSARKVAPLSAVYAPPPALIRVGTPADAAVVAWASFDAGDCTPATTAVTT